MTSNIQLLLKRVEAHSAQTPNLIQDLLHLPLCNGLINSLPLSEPQGQILDEDCLKLFRICQNLISLADLSKNYQIINVLLKLLDKSQESLQKSVLLEALSSCFVAFSRSFNLINNPNDFGEAFKYLGLLKSSETMITSETLKKFENLFKLKLIPLVWQVLNKQEVDIQYFLGVLKAVNESQKYEINMKHLDFPLFCKALNLVENDSTAIKEKQMILGHLASFQDIQQDQKEKMQRLIQNFGFSQMSSASKQDKKHSIPSPEIVIPHLSESLCLYSTTSADDLEVKVYRYDSGAFSMAVKTYNQEIKTESFNRIDSEIQILRSLSPRSKQDQYCFLKFFWEYFKGNSAYLAMEFHEDTLESKIQQKIKNNERFPPDELRRYIQKLLISFEIMKKKGVFHRDIKPANILVTKDGELRIIDFSVAFQINQQEISFGELVRVTGSGFFMAPEVLEGNLNGQKFIEASNEKADVFSLGMTILYMVVLDKSRLETLNFFTNNQRLKQIVLNEVKEEYLKTLLLGMLDCDKEKRFEFRRCISAVDDDLATIC